MADEQKFFLKCCKEGDLGVVMRYLPEFVKNGQLEFRDDYGLTALGWACWNGHADIANELIRNGSNVNSKDNENQTPLFNACYSGLYEICVVLINNGADLNATDIDGESPFAAAAQRGHIRIVKLLMDCNCNPLTVDTSGVSPLKSAKEGIASKSLVALIERYVVEYAVNNKISMSIIDGMKTRISLQLSGKWFVKSYSDLLSEISLSWKVSEAALSFGDETGRFEEKDHPDGSDTLSRLSIHVWPSAGVKHQLQVPKCRSIPTERRTSLKGDLPPSRSSTLLSSVSIRSTESIQEPVGLFYPNSIATKSIRSVSMSSNQNHLLPPSGAPSRSTTATSMASEIGAIVRSRVAQRGDYLKPGVQSHGVIKSSSITSGQIEHRSVSMASVQPTAVVRSESVMTNNRPQSSVSSSALRKTSMHSTRTATSVDNSHSTAVSERSFVKKDVSRSHSTVSSVLPQGIPTPVSMPQVAVIRSDSAVSSVVLPEGLPAPASVQSVISKEGIAGGGAAVSFPAPVSVRSHSTISLAQRSASYRSMTSVTSAVRQKSVARPPPAPTPVVSNVGIQRQLPPTPTRRQPKPQPQTPDNDSDCETEASPELTTNRKSYLSTLQQIRGRVLFGRKYEKCGQSETDSEEEDDDEETEQENHPATPSKDVKIDNNITLVDPLKEDMLTCDSTPDVNCRDDNQINNQRQPSAPPELSVSRDPSALRELSTPLVPREPSALRELSTPLVPRDPSALRELSTPLVPRELLALREPSTPSALREPLVASVPREPLVASVPREPLVASVPREPLVASVPREPLVASVPREPLVASVPREPLVASVPREPLVASVPREPLVASVPREPLVASVPREPLVASVPREPSASTTICETEVDVVTESVTVRSKSEVTICVEESEKVATMATQVKQAHLSYDERKAKFEAITGVAFPEPLDEEFGESVSLPADETVEGGRQCEFYGPPTILHESAANGEVHVIEYLLSTQQKIIKETDLDAQDELGRTPLMYSCITGKLKAVQLLISKKCSVNIRDSEGHTAIFHATKGGHNDILQWLSESVKGIDFHALDGEGHSLTQWACYKGYLSTLRYLTEVLNVRLDLPDYQDRLCIHWAAKQGAVDAIKYLIQKGCAISLHDRFNKTAEDYAIEAQHWGAVATLREAKLQTVSGQQSSQWRSDISRALSVSKGFTAPSSFSKFSSVGTTRLG